MKIKNTFIVVLLILFIVLASFVLYQRSQINTYIQINNSLNKNLDETNNQLSIVQKKHNRLIDVYSDTTPHVIDRNGKEWKKYISNSDISFTLLYPVNWRITSTVFMDEKGKKVAEFIPGIKNLGKDDQCFEEQKYKSNYYLGSVKQEQVSIGKYKGSLKIEKVGYEGGYPNWNGVWYPNSYCLIDGDRAFYMTFYEYEEKPTQQKLYEEILSSLNIQE